MGRPSKLEVGHKTFARGADREPTLLAASCNFLAEDSLVSNRRSSDEPVHPAVKKQQNLYRESQVVSKEEFKAREAFEPPENFERRAKEKNYSDILESEPQPPSEKEKTRSEMVNTQACSWLDARTEAS